MSVTPHRVCRGCRAFTLIEIMVVVAIIGLVAAAGVPTLYRMLHREGFGKTVADFMELCSKARARAILQGTTTQIVFHPKERRCELEGGGAEAAVTFGDDVQIEMLDVNLLEYKDSDLARVHFFPNGMSDEMTVILRSDVNDWRKISLEITTALASLDSDPHHWR